MIAVSKTDMVRGGVIVSASSGLLDGARLVAVSNANNSLDVMHRTAVGGQLVQAGGGGQGGSHQVVTMISDLVSTVSD